MTLLARSLSHDRVGARSPFLNSCLCCEGGSDPTNFLGGWKPKKWGRSRPFWCFFHGDFRLRWFSISHSAKKLLAPQVEELGEDDAEVCSSYVLHLFPQVPAQEPQPGRALRSRPTGPFLRGDF